MAENVYQDKALQKYLKEIADIEPLSREEENKLAKKAKKGDKEAINKLMRSNLKFVVKIASKYQYKGLSLAELISEGNTGLYKAIQKFDPERGNKLISYAVWWIKQRILFALAEKTSLVRLPLGKANTANKIKNAEEKVFSHTGRRPTIKEIAEETGLDEKIIRKVKKQNVDTVSIDKKNYTDGHDKVAISKFLTDDEIDEPKTLYYRDKVRNSIKDSIENLPSREAYIIKEYFGLEGKESKNFVQIAKKLGLSRERVRQIQKAALKKILEDVYKESENDIDYLINMSG